MKGIASMKVEDKGEAAAPKPLSSPLSAKNSALRQAFASLKKAMEAVEAAMKDEEG